MTCFVCNSTTSDKWLKVVLQPAAYDSINPPIYPWVADGEAIEYHFHAPECRTQWLERCQLPL
jgi:hypothetical protein